MELMYFGQIYVHIYYIILCLPKVLCRKLTGIEKFEYCKHLRCDETEHEKVCGVRIENGINTYRIFDNECLLLKYGCQVDSAEAYGIINMKHCDEITLQENDGTTCQTNCVSDIKEPVCGIRKDGEGFRIKLFSNMCQLSKYNCEKQLQFIITDSFLCNRHKSMTQRRNTDEFVYSEITEGFNDSNDTFDTKIREIEKPEKSAGDTNNTEWEIENTINIETSTLETINLENGFEEMSTVETNHIETYALQRNSTEEDVNTNTTNENNVKIETPATIVNQEQNKTILRNIVVVRGSLSDMQNINRSVADFFAATHVFDLPVREMEPNLTENTRRRLVKIFGPIKVFKPWLTKPDVIKEDRNHTPTLSSCFHKCPTKCPDTYTPVCGTPGIVAREPSLMFQNHCYMDVAQCKMFWENNSPTSHSSAYIESSFLFCLGDELQGLYRFLPLIRTLQHMGRLKNKGKFKYRLKNMRFFNNLLDKQPHLMG